MQAAGAARETINFGGPVAISRIFEVDPPPGVLLAPAAGPVASRGRVRWRALPLTLTEVKARARKYLRPDLR